MNEIGNLFIYFLVIKMAEKDWADVKIGVKRDTHNDLKDLKYDMRVDTFDEVVQNLIKGYKENKKE